MSRRGDINKLIPGSHSSKTQLMSAAEHGNSAKVVKLIDEDEAQVDCMNELGMTALHFASTGEVVRALCERGADVDAETYSFNMEKPLCFAVDNDYDSVVAELIAQGADVDAKCNRVCTPISCCFPFSDTRLPKRKAFAALMAGGAELRDGELYLTVSKRCLEGVRMLVDAGADMTLKFAPYDIGLPPGLAPETPLSQAVRRGSREIADFLQSRGAPM